VVAFLIVAAGCSGGTVTVDNQGAQGVFTSPDGPPVEVNADKDGVRGAPTPTPHAITPIVPIATPAATATPRPA
jgi:hypothetical protein